MGALGTNGLREQKTLKRIFKIDQKEAATGVVL